MIGKVTVTTKNPPCPSCGRMAGFHSKKCGPSTMTDTQRLEFYLEIVAKDRNRLSQSDTDEEGNPRSPVWFWEQDQSDAEYATFREAIDAELMAKHGPVRRAAR